MPFAWTECQWCRSKRRSYFDKEQLRRLARGEKPYRICPFCQVPTLWALVEPRRPGEALPGEVISHPPSVLLIDDDNEILTILSRALVKKTFYVDVADSAREALSKMVNEDFDVVISDIHMRGFDGKKLYAFIEDYMPEYKNRVVFLTADTESPDTRQFLERTGCPYLFKPINFDELFRAIEGRLEPRERQTD